MTDYNFKRKKELSPIAELPDPFLRPDGQRIRTAAEWPEQRAYLKAMLAHYLYGEMPPAPAETRGELLFSRPAYDGRALIERIKISTGPKGSIVFYADLIRPHTAEKVPVIVWNQFKGRQGCPLEYEIVCERGYAILEFDKEQLAPDNAHALQGPAGQAYPDCSWGAIAIWAWGHMRVIDWLEQTDFCALDKIVVTGHSRGGKAAACAAIYDERAAVCAANGSGCGGLGCFRFLGGRLGRDCGICETAGNIQDVFPYWWSDRLAEFGLRRTSYTRLNCPENYLPSAAAVEELPLGQLRDEEYLPFDLHFLRALIAPRAVISTDALEDTWANPYGTQINYAAAQEVFDFLGVPDHNAMHFREGGHDYERLDFAAVIDYCDYIFYNKSPRLPLLMSRVPDASETAAAARVRRTNEQSRRRHFSWRKP